MNILDLLREDGHEPKLVSSTSGGEYSCSCPSCGGKDRLRLWPGENGNGRWWCRQCGKKGDAVQYLRDIRGLDFPAACSYLGMTLPAGRVQPAFPKKPETKTPAPDMAERYHQNLLNDTSAVSYLVGRKITLDTVKRFKLGLYPESETRWLSIPHYQGEKLVNIKFRSLPPATKEFKRIQGCKSVLFNSDAVKGREEIFISEGELDAITLLQAGLDNAVSGTTGAASFDPEWIDQCRHLKKIYLVYDSDEAGQKGARSLAKRLGYGRCYNVILPDGVKDVNDFFQDHALDDFKKLVEQARPFDLPGVYSIETALSRLREIKTRGQEDQGLMTPWPSVNRLTRGFHPGDLIVLSAPPKTGKTTFALEVCRQLATEEIPTLFYCLEMRPERLAYKVIQARCRKAEPTADDIERAEVEFRRCGYPLYFAHSFYKEKLDSVLGLIREAIQRFDLRLVVFDNLHFLIRSVSNVNEELGQAVQGFKLLAEEMEIPIIAIAQPRKRENTAQDEVMRAEDIKYSNAVHSDCDTMILLWRKRTASKAKDLGADTPAVQTEALSPLALVRVEAHRYGPGGETLLHFHGDQSRYEERT